MSNLDKEFSQQINLRLEIYAFASMVFNMDTEHIKQLEADLAPEFGTDQGSRAVVKICRMIRKIKPDLEEIEENLKKADRKQQLHDIA